MVKRLTSQDVTQKKVSYALVRMDINIFGELRYTYMSSSSTSSPNSLIINVRLWLFETETNKETRTAYYNTFFSYHLLNSC